MRGPPPPDPTSLRYPGSLVRWRYSPPQGAGLSLLENPNMSSPATAGDPVGVAPLQIPENLAFPEALARRELDSPQSRAKTNRVKWLKAIALPARGKLKEGDLFFRLSRCGRAAVMARRKLRRRPLALRQTSGWVGR